jgi:hypothetical protein
MKGRCRTCAPWGPDLEQSLEYISDEDTYSLQCPVFAEYAEEDSQKPLNAIFNVIVATGNAAGIKGSILAFVILICLSNVVMCSLQVKNTRGKKRGNSTIQ